MILGSAAIRSADHLEGNMYRTDLIEGPFSKYGRGFLRKTVGEKKLRQGLHAARKELHATNTPETFEKYLTSKRALLAGLKSKKMLQVNNVTTKRQLQTQMAQGRDIMGSVLKKPLANAPSYNRRLVAKMSKRMETPGVNYYSTKDPQYKYGGAKPRKGGGGRVRSGPRQPLSAVAAAHEVGHLASGNQGRLYNLFDDYASYKKSGKIPDAKAIAGIQRRSINEELFANQQVAKNFKMNRRNRLTMIRAMDSHAAQMSTLALAGKKPMSDYKRDSANYIQGVRQISRAARRVGESTDSVWQNLMESRNDPARLADFMGSPTKRYGRRRRRYMTQEEYYALNGND